MIVQQVMLYSTTTNKLSNAKAERSTSIRPKKGKMKRTNDSRDTSKKGVVQI